MRLRLTVSLLALCALGYALGGPRLSAQGRGQGASGGALTPPARR